jgi:hypothetical protein
MRANATPSIQLKRKSNDLGIVWRLMIPKRTNMSAQISKERGQEVKTECFLCFKILKFDGDLWDEMVCDWRKSIDGKRG